MASRWALGRWDPFELARDRVVEREAPVGFDRVVEVRRRAPLADRAALDRLAGLVRLLELRVALRVLVERDRLVDVRAAVRDRARLPLRAAPVLRLVPVVLRVVPRVVRRLSVGTWAPLSGSWMCVRVLRSCR